MYYAIYYYFKLHLQYNSNVNYVQLGKYVTNGSFISCCPWTRRWESWNFRFRQWC
jgi:hypothetical protein